MVPCLKLVNISSLLNKLVLKKIVVFINKADVADEEMLELVEMEIREVLSGYGFDGDNTEIVSGSALCALQDKDDNIGKESIGKLMDVLDSIEPPERDLESPAVITVDGVCSIKGRGTVVTGLVRRGVVKKGDTLDFFGFGKHEKGAVITVDGVCSIKGRGTVVT